MRNLALFRSALLTFAASLFLAAPFALAQHGDVMVGGSILESATPLSDVATFQTPQEKIGLYPSLGFNYFTPKHRIGLNVETSWRYHQGNYYGYERYRPIFVDANAMYQFKVTRRVGVDLMGGIGVAVNRFDVLGPCDIPGCTNYTSSNHFMEDLAMGVRYRFWRNFFVRPEFHYYHIQDNQGFNSDNVFRLGASVGYNFGHKPAPPPAPPQPAGDSSQH